jgi:hypothetical protein
MACTEAMSGTEAMAGIEAMGGSEPVMPPSYCAEDYFTRETESASVTPIPTYNASMPGVRDIYTTYLQVEMTLATRPGSYDLAGKTPETCAVCVYLFENCRQGECQHIYFADHGTVRMTELGGSGGKLSGTMDEVGFARLDRDSGTLIESSETGVCVESYEFSTALPALVDYPVPEFSLQNCTTGEIESIYDYGDGAQGIWYIATAGWCPACRQHLNNLFSNIFPTFTDDSIRPMIVVTEDDNYEPATLDFCKSYLRRYPAEWAPFFYLDAGLATTFSNMWIYLDENGSFGLPWNALIRSSDRVMTHADGAPRANLQNAVNAMLNGE